MIYHIFLFLNYHFVQQCYNKNNSEYLEQTNHDNLSKNPDILAEIKNLELWHYWHNLSTVKKVNIYNNIIVNFLYMQINDTSFILSKKMKYL